MAVIVQEWLEDIPSQSSIRMPNVFGSRFDQKLEAEVRGLEEEWEISVEFGDIRPSEATVG